MSFSTECFYVKKTQNNTNLTVAHLDEPIITRVDQIQAQHPRLPWLILAARWSYSSFKLEGQPYFSHSVKQSTMHS